MSAFDKASIVQIPSGYKASVLYSIVPDTGAGDLSVVRATTATRVNSSGLIESVAVNVPRIDYTGGISCGELLVEPQRTNLVLESEDFSAGSWTPTNATITTNTEVAPDGTTTADTLTATANNGQVQFVHTGSSATAYNVSFYIKRKTGSGDVFIRSVENVDTLITVTSEWTRVDLTTTSTTTSIRAGIKLAVSGDEVYIWGAQLEQGSYVTSYIPTSGSTVTRNADVISKTSIASLLGDSEGALFVEAAPFDASDENFFSISDGTVNNRVVLGTPTSSTLIEYRLVVGGVAQVVSTGGSLSDNTFTKLALRYSLNDFAAYQDGSSIITDTSGSVFSDGTLTGLFFANAINGNQPFYGRIRQLVIFDQALTNDELAAITT